MTKYIVTASVLANIEVEADTPLDAKIMAMEDRVFEAELHNAEHDIQVYHKGDEPMYLKLRPELVETLTGILGYELDGRDKPDGDLQRVYEELVDFLKPDSSVSM